MRSDSFAYPDVRLEAAARALADNDNSHVEELSLDFYRLLAKYVLEAADAVSEPTPPPNDYELALSMERAAVEARVAAETERDKAHAVLRITIQRTIDLEEALRQLVDSLEVDGAEVTLTDAVERGKIVLGGGHAAAGEPLTPPRVWVCVGCEAPILGPDRTEHAEGCNKPGTKLVDEPLTPPRGDASELKIDALNGALSVCQSERDYERASVARLKERAGALEGALRALVTRCPDCGGSGVIHREGWFSNEIPEGHECETCSECDRCGPARRALLAESTPKEES